MWVCIFSCRQFEDTFENTQWRKAMEVQPMWLCVLLFTPFEVAFKITYWWRKDKQKERHLNIHIRGNLHKCNLCDYAATQAVHLKAHLKTHSGEKPYKCTQCIYASANLCNLRKHICTVGAKNRTYATNASLPLMNHVRWWFICEWEKIVIIWGVVCLPRGQREIEASIMVNYECLLVIVLISATALQIFQTFFSDFHLKF